MKKWFLLFFLAPSLSSASVIINPSPGGAGGTDNYPATATIRANYGIDATTITVSTLTVHSSATFENVGISQWTNVSVATFTGMKVFMSSITWPDGTVQVSSPGAGASLAIGSPVVGGGIGRVLFIDGSGNLADDSSFSYDPTVLSLGTILGLAGNLQISSDLTIDGNVSMGGVGYFSYADSDFYIQTLDPASQINIGAATQITRLKDLVVIPNYILGGLENPSSYDIFLLNSGDDPATPASGTLTFNGNPTSSEEITVTDGDGNPFTLIADSDFSVDGDKDVTATNLCDAINSYFTGGELVCSDDSSGHLTLTCATPGTTGNIPIDNGLTNVVETGMSGGTNVGPPVVNLYVDRDTNATGNIVSSKGATFGGGVFISSTLINTGAVSLSGAGATHETSFLVGANAGLDATSADNSNFIGTDAGNGATNAASSNFLGTGAGINASGANNSNFFGPNAGYGATDAFESNFFGNTAGYGATGANDSNFFGTNAGNVATGADNSNFFGTSAGNGATDATGSNFFGFNAGKDASAAELSNFFGFQAGEGATNAGGSNFYGSVAGYGATNAGGSNFSGFQAGQLATDAYSSNFYGTASGKSATNAFESNFFGKWAGFGATNANNSQFFGVQAGSAAVNAAHSIFIGDYSGRSDTVDNTGGGSPTSIAIGEYSGTNGFQNSVAIGHGVINSNSSQMNLGNAIKIEGIYNPNSNTRSSATLTNATVYIGTGTAITNSSMTTTAYYTNGQKVGIDFSTYSLFGQSYSFTTTTTTLTHGTSSMTVTLASSGTYRIDASADLRYVGATFAANQFVSLNLYRQNNTPGVITNSQIQEETGIVTTITSQFGQFNIPTIFYTTVNTNDVISFHGSITATPGAGSFQAIRSNLTAQRLY